jgi:uncharacterized repeat protein (TIGR03803 family)
LLANSFCIITPRETTKVWRTRSSDRNSRNSQISEPFVPVRDSEVCSATIIAKPHELTVRLSGQYGTTANGGSSGNGTVFKLNTDGTGFTSLHNFTTTTATGGPLNSDGAFPLAGLLLPDNTLYGTTFRGGTADNGTLFSISWPVIQPQLTITPIGGNAILSWPTDASGFALQSRTNLASQASWTTVPAGPVVINGQNMVTNPISGTQQFYRLFSDGSTAMK